MGETFGLILIFVIAIILFIIFHKLFDVFYFGFKGVAGVFIGCVFGALLIIELLGNFIIGVWGFILGAIPWVIGIVIVLAVVNHFLPNTSNDADSNATDEKDKL